MLAVAGGSFYSKTNGFSICSGPLLLFYSKTLGFSMISVAGSIKPMLCLAISFAGSIKPICFHACLDPIYKTNAVLIRFLDPIYKTNAFLILFWTLSIQPMFFEHC